MSRPEILFPLFAPVSALSGVGPRIAKLIEAVAGPHVVDLLWHHPTGIIDRRFAPQINEAPDGVIATITVTVGPHAPSHNKRMPYRVSCHDDSGEMQLVFFHAHEDYLRKTLPEGEQRIISGRVEHFRGEVQMTHPDHMVLVDERESLQAVEPVYPLTAGFTHKTCVKAVRGALERVPDLPEWNDKELLSRQGWSDWRISLKALHAPQSEKDFSPDASPRRRLAYDELLASQLALGLVRAQYRRRPGRVTKGDGHLREKALAALPFSLTSSQTKATEEILTDMADPARMLRLLQGDVGSGKTVVALLGLLNAVEAGSQAALMAPTEILARQHMATIEPLAQAAGIAAVLLTGREKGKTREAVLAGLASGETALCVGTHALFQDDVIFHDLAFAVVDEQHRFGVHQRLMLAEKGAGTDVLVMTATPIPRTLTLAAFGDLDVSRLTEKPPGRKPVETRALPLSSLGQVIERVAAKSAKGERVYWVCPLIEESEVLDVAAASERFETLKKIIGDRVGLVHGAMKGKDKDAVMAQFTSGEITVLVATTVIEVGVDVPEATVMVIEQAERFGLAQLHQLRGRIGRGAEASVCILLYAQPLGATAKARIDIMRQTDDGFRIAEEDLRLRGAGEVLGTRQSGLPELRLADLAVDGELLEIARKDARLILEKNPGLEGERGKALRVLLYLFERDGVVKYARAG